jgi:hypothetical protein
VGSKTSDGVWFISYSHDHAPPHVHGDYGRVRVVVELLPDGSVQDRTDLMRSSQRMESAAMFGIFWL